MHRPTIRLAASAAFVVAFLLGGVATPAAQAAITGSHITTPSDPSFFVADEDAKSQTFAISGTTSGGNPASDRIDVRCYHGGTSAKVVGNAPDFHAMTRNAPAGNPFNFAADRGSNNFDIRHTLNLTALYELPFGEGKRYLGHAPRLVEAVANGEAPLGVFGLNILMDPRLDVVGPMPGELQREVVYAAAIAANSTNQEAAQAFMRYLLSPRAAAVIKAKGMNPA